MSRYQWPKRGRGGSDDDPGGRAGFMGRRRVDFDRDGALEAGRSALRATAARAVRDGRRVPLAAPDPVHPRKNLWQPLGPMTVIHGQAIGDPRIAGRVNALAVHPDGARVYAASADGGVWYSSNGGETWRALGGFAPTVTAEINRPAQRNVCGAILATWGDTEAGDTVFVGTGETQHTTPNAQPGDALGGIGVLVATGPALSAPADNPWSREAKNLLGAGVDRLAMEPGGTTVVAATKIGLFQRPEPPVQDGDWPRVAGEPFASLTNPCTDVLWTAAQGSAPARLWVWVKTGESAGLWVRDAGEVNFTKIATPGAKQARAVLAASTPPSQVYLLNDQGKNVPAALYQISSVAAAKPAALPVAGVPDVLGKQGSYDIALDVHPSNPNRVVLGGSIFDFVAPDGLAMDKNSLGAIIVGEVGLVGSTPTFGTPAPSMMIGVGVHPDVHALKYSNSGNRLWAGCDGGVFLSDSPTKQVSFIPRNTGLAIVESNYIASHPTCEGFVVMGLQDNGLISRASNGVWDHVGSGDGGGVVFDPLKPTEERILRQFTNGEWNSPEGYKSMLTRNGVFYKDESDASAFYSTAAAIGQHRLTAPVDPPDAGQIIVGTTRVWYTEDFGKKWVTLPKGTDGLPDHPTQDDFGEKITVCRWQSPDVAWILGEGMLKRYSRKPRSDVAGGPGTWNPVERIISRECKGKLLDSSSVDGPLRDSKVWTDIAVNLDPTPPGGQPGDPPVQHGTKGAIYLGTIGSVDDTDVDTLWWFDGTSNWFKTGLRKDVGGVPAPVTAIVCDPDHPEEVYVGTTVGVWKGVRTQASGATPIWSWESRVNGLPEAAVEDLTIFRRGTLRLLRAAIASRGAWELRLDTEDMVDRTYVRAHEDDLRYLDTAYDKTRGSVKELRSWHGSPDVRPRRAPAVVASAAASPPLSPVLTWTRHRYGVEDLRRFQSALRAMKNDARVRATGSWDDYFNEVLRDLGAPRLPSPPAPANTVCIDDAFWDAVMNFAQFNPPEPWGTGKPTEADLYELTAKLTEGDLNQTSCILPAGPTKVDIVVHRRGLDPIDGANVRVALLMWTDPAARWYNPGTWSAGAVPWTAVVTAFMNGATDKYGPPLGPLGAGWTFVDVVNGADVSQRQTLAGQTIDPTTSGIATFDLTLPTHRVVLLVAVIRAGTSPADDIALSAAANLGILAFGSPNVAVRSVYVR